MADQSGRPLAGAIFFATIALAVLAGAYAMWPPDVFSTPLAGMSPAMLLRLAASMVLVFIGLEFLWALAIVTQSDH